MKKKADISKFDKRIVNRLIDKGQVQKNDYEKFQENMPDVTKKAETINVEYARKKKD